MADLQAFKSNLEASPVARARFLVSVFDMLEKNGVDVNDPEIATQLDLNLDLRNGKDFAGGSVASTNIITIVN